LLARGRQIRNWVDHLSAAHPGLQWVAAVEEIQNVDAEPEHRVFASRADVLLSLGRRPNWPLVRQGRAGAGRQLPSADRHITDLIRHAATCRAPDPGVVYRDDGLEFTALGQQVRAALEKEPRKKPDRPAVTADHRATAVPLHTETFGRL
jgi:hypothetical protein